MFTRNLRERRGVLRRTQAEVARAAGMDQAVYSRIERGRRDPSIHTLTRIARALDTTPSKLLQGVK